MEKENVVDYLGKQLILLGFRLVPLMEKKQEFERLGKEFPSRVNETHHIQEMYIFEYLGYRAVINTGIIEGKLLIEKGLSWVLIVKDYKPLFTRAFRSNTCDMSKVMADRLIAYAQLTRNIILHRPLDLQGKLKDLVEIEDSVFNKPLNQHRKCLKNYWMADFDPPEDLFSTENEKLYFSDIDKKFLKLIRKKEYALNRYYMKDRTAKKFRKEIRKKSVTKKPEHTYVK
jgi:hypothetical protein